MQERKKYKQNRFRFFQQFEFCCLEKKKKSEISEIWFPHSKEQNVDESAHMLPF